MPYDFEWGVQDEDSGNAFSHVENSDGQTTQGEYRVLLPDGRTQVRRKEGKKEGGEKANTYLCRINKNNNISHLRGVLQPPVPFLNISN